MKNEFCLLLVLVMLLGMLPTVALAAEDEAPHGSCGENATWRYDAENPNADHQRHRSDDRLRLGIPQSLGSIARLYASLLKKALLLSATRI